jgi:UDP-N-acetylmuramoyl-tripeptide--D-alanyl-D-alanine ligase
MSLGTVADLTGGHLDGGADAEALVTGPVVIDSRRAEPGSLFVCVVGEQLDGHDFAAAAVAGGAVAAVGTRATGVPTVVVGDTQAALAALATGVLARSHCRVVGVTGSSGKTSTKDMLAAVFAAHGATVAPEGSFNNELGLPLTVLRVSEDTRTLVLEYSARGAGHIRYLCGIARPDISIVLNVGHAHLGEFGSREGIAAAKGELVEALAPDGTAVLNADDPLVAAMRARTTARTMTFGTDEAADVRITDIDTDRLARARVSLATPAGDADIALRLHGRHQAANAAAVVTAALAADVPLATAVEALQALTSLSPHRMQMHERGDGLVVIDDAYNANPDSVRAALQALVGMAAGHGRSWAVLGPMRELGDSSDALHAEVGADAAQLGVDELVVVGADAGEMLTGAQQVTHWRGRVRRVPDTGAATQLVAAEAAPGDVVLVKASNSEQLWRLADALIGQVPAGADGGRG